ncbi:MAG: HAD family phosphatase [Acidobacteria bacterium]|nr:HAD family phosphatase [Acidobacteriota bacterium]
MTQPFPLPIKVICFDVDGTLVEHAEGKTVWQLLNERFIGEPLVNQARLSAFRGGEITYAEWVELDISDWMLRGIRRGEIEGQIMEHLAVVPGARETMDVLRRRGYRLAVVSGTLDLTLELLLAGFPFDVSYTNRIFFEPSGRISGWRATRYDTKGKARAIEEIAAAFGCAPESCAFVGDHWNDIEALTRAGVGIAYRPKDDAVRRAADLVVEDGPLTRLLEYFPGLST